VLAAAVSAVIIFYEWAEDGRDDEAEREGSGRKAAIPFELIDQRRHQQGERSSTCDPDRHRHKGDGDDDPALEEGQSRRPVPWALLHGVLNRPTQQR
jgi:hypothetical protein